MNENIINTTEEVLVKVTEEIATPELPRKGFGKKATIGVLAVTTLVAAVKFGYDYYKKTKNGKEVEVVTDEEEASEDMEDTDSDDTIE